MLRIRLALSSLLFTCIATQAAFEDYRYIIENSGASLNSIFKTHKLFDDALEASGIKNEVDLQQLAVGYNHLVKEFEQKNPLFFMHECTKQGSLQACPLSRNFIAKARRGFEDHVAKLLLQKASLQEDPIQYMSFASGGLFQDLMILLKFLKQKPDAKMSIHFVDPQFARYVEIYRQFKEGREISSNKGANDLLPIMDALVQYVRVTWRLDHLNDQEIAKEVMLYFLWEDASFKQLINYLQRLFPQATLSFMVYTHAEDYLNCMSDQDLPYPDVLVSADIEDDKSISNNAPQHFVLLCKKALEEKPNSSNVLLSRIDGFFESVAYTKDDAPLNMAKLLTFSLEPASTQHFDVNGTPIYVTAKAIQPDNLWEHINEYLQRLACKKLGLIKSTYI